MKKLLLLFLFGILSLQVFSQRADENYSYELSGGIKLSTNGGVLSGFNLNYRRKLTSFQAHAFTFEVAEIKHPKEVRYTSAQTGQYFIFAKNKHLHPFRFLYGREFFLLKKNPDEGIRLSLIVQGGLSLGLVKPYYVEYNFGSTTDSSNIQIVPYDQETLDPFKVRSGGYLFRGLGKSTINPGFHLKSSLNFEISPYIKPEPGTPTKSSVTGIETGFEIEYYSKEVPIMAFDYNRQLYTAFFITLYYGKRW